jgi:hypothetical protein
VEHLIRRSCRPEHVVDSPQRQRVANRLGGRRVCPGAVGNQQRALGVRVELPHSLEQLTACCIPERLRREYQRHLLAGVCQLCQQSERLLRITLALDAVVAAVPPDEVSFDVLEGVAVFVDGEKEGEGHRLCAHPSGRHGAQ